MSRVQGTFAFVAVLWSVLVLTPEVALAQDEQPPSEAPPAAEEQAPEQTSPPNPEDLTTQPNEPLTEGAQPQPEAPAEEYTPTVPPAVATPTPAPEDRGPLLDGHLREGAFLSGPGSLTFVLHHSIMGGAGGLATQGIPNRFKFDTLGAREAILAGTLVGAGLGFGFSAWWQFNHWIGLPSANFGIVNSVIAGMALTGLIDLMTNDATALAYTAFLGAEIGAWLTTIVGGGELSVAKGLLIASGGGWGLAYTALLLGILSTSGSAGSTSTAIDALLIAPGIGAGALALAGMKYSPTSTQILRADVFGAGVGAGVFLLSGLVLGRFDQPTPYVLSFLA